MKHFKKALSTRKYPEDSNVENSPPDNQEDDASRRDSLQPGYGLFRTQSPRFSESFTVRASTRSYTNASDPQRPDSRSPGGQGQGDPYGLHVIYKPDEEIGHKLDIVFVHGLGGTSRMTWSKDKDLDYFWPKVFLPNEPEICDARISTFGYNSSVLKGGSGRTTVSILDFAKELLFDLKYATDENGEKMDIGATPIIFVVHSMGGLIVKMAYMQGLYDPEYKSIVSAISSIIFLATPHRGSDFAETLNKVLKATMIRPPRKFVNDLAKNSSTLLKLNEEFRHFAPSVGLASFYETRTTAIGTDRVQIMVVNPDSATLGYPGETSASMDADHHTICKYESQKNPNYLKVRNYIKSRVSNILQSQRSKKNHSPCAEDASRERKLRTLLNLGDPPDSDFIFFKDRCLPGTCTWILGNTAFLEWVNDLGLHPRVLWLQGGPGTGKSVVASFVIDHLVKQGLNCHYFFIRFGDQQKRSLSTLLRSLAFQIAQSSKLYQDRIMRLADEGAKLRKADAQNLWQRLFREILFKLELTIPMYWIIDGLDECDTPRRLIKMINELSRASLPIRVLIVSRKQRDLSAEFSRLNDIQLNIIANDGCVEDFEKYIELELDVPGPPAYRERVTRQILKRAHGNFLWITLAINKLNACQTAAKREQALEKLPPGMDRFFDRMAQSIADIEDPDDKELASDILSWATCSLRELTVAELLEALHMKESEMPDLRRSIQDLSAGFIVVDNSGTISLVHKTAKEYLLGDTSSRPISVNAGLVSERIFLRCMECISTRGLRASIRAGKTPRLFEYAVTSWFVHLTAASPQSERVLLTVIKFLTTNSVLTWIQALATIRRLRLLVRASSALTMYATKLKDRQTTEREMLENWAIDLIKIVGKFGSNLLQKPESIYKVVPPFCPPESSIYKTFGTKEQRLLAVSGLSATRWDDSLARLQFGPNVYVSAILAVGNWIATMVPSGTVLLFHATTFEKVGHLEHGERTSRMQRSSTGTMLVTYGYATTKIWDVASRECILSVTNPPSRPKAHCLCFIDDDETLLLGGDDRIVYALSLHATDAPSWEVVAELGEEQIKGAIVNSPTVVGISPDGKLIFYGYRAHPISTWTVDGDHVGVAFRNDSEHLKGRTMSTECMQAVWHPHANTCQVVGLYEDGTVFRWNPIEEEYCEIPAHASRLAISHDGNLFATGDSMGRVKLYSTADLELVYQLRSQDVVHDLTFSPDANRFYDVRGAYANVWEPSALMWLTELTDQGSDSVSETETDSSTVATKSSISEVVAKRLDPITAVAGQPHGRLYCCGTEDGMTQVFDVSRGKIALIEQSVGYFTTEKIVWSPNGEYLCYSSISMVTIKKVILSDDDGEPGLLIESIGGFKPMTFGGAVTEMLFDSHSTHLFIYTTAGIATVSLEEKKISVSRKLDENIRKWVNHPSDPTRLLAVSHDTIDVLDWNTLATCQVFNFNQIQGPLLDIPGNWPCSPSAGIGSSNRWTSSEKTSAPHEGGEEVEDVLVTSDQSHILVQVSAHLNKDAKEKRLLLFSVEALAISYGDQRNPNSGSTPPVTNLHPVILPPDITSRVDIPLSFVSSSSRERDRLVFLDHNSWLCSWRLSTLTSPHQTQMQSLRSQSSPTDSISGTGTRILQHYFLPADWISPDCLALATVLDDGSLLIPRNGEVAVVQCESVRVGTQSW